jgi:soluble lytic murein transglycosylase-like protein
MPCDNVLTVRWMAVAGVVLAGMPLGAEPAISREPVLVDRVEQYGQERPAGPAIERVYRIQADEDTGRLIRRAVRKSQKSGSISSRGVVGTREVVQGGSRTSTKVRGLDLNSLVRRTASQLDVEPELIYAVIRQESGYDPYAVSHKGAKGLMQLMPATAKRFGVKDVFDPAENVQGGVKYLRQLLDRYDGDRRLALAAYNAGEGAVDRFGGVPPYRETQDYVDRIVGPSEADTTADTAVEESAEPVAQRVRATEQNGTLLFEAH